MVEDIGVELHVFVLVFGFSQGNCRPGMAIEAAGNYVGYHISPLNLLAHRYHVILYDLQNRLDTELRIFQETHQQLERAVSGASADAEQRAVNEIAVESDPLDGVRKGQLLVVMAVNADTFSRQMFLEELYNLLNLFAIVVAVAVDDVNGIDGGPG